MQASDFLAIKMEHIPTEIILKICEYVFEDSPESLRAFAKTCRALRSVASIVLFRTVSLRISWDTLSTSPVQRLNAILEHASSFEHVRVLKIVGRWQTRKENWIEGYEEANDEHNLVQSQQDEWQQCAHLIERLRSLRDLKFFCDRQLPICIHDVLQKHLPLCRLHIEQFYIRSQADPILDPRELAIATSSNLYNINISQYLFTAEYNLDRMPAVALKLSSGLAPNLKEVCIQYFREPGRTPVAHWPRLDSINLESKPRTGSLERLKLDGFSDLCYPTLLQWSAHTNLSLLHTLELCGSLPSDQLTWLAGNHTFDNLKTLKLWWVASKELMDDPPSQAVNALLCALRPLSVLVLKWLARPYVRLESILSHHGKSLRKLKVRESKELIDHFRAPAHWMLYHWDFKEIKERSLFQGLKRINVVVRRSKGDSNEVYQYKVLGSLPRLCSITLHLNVWDYHQSYSLKDGEDSDPFHTQFFYNSQLPGQLHLNYGNVLDILINSAVDHKLALDIYETIESGKPHNSTRLKKLILKPDTQIFRMRSQRPVSLRRLVEVVNHICGSWKVSRDYENSLSRSATVEAFGYSYHAPNDLTDTLEPIFRRLWPKQNHETGPNWMTDWHSFPLEHD